MKRIIFLLVGILYIFGCTTNKAIGPTYRHDYNYTLENTFVINIDGKENDHKIYLEYPREFVKNGNTVTQKLIKSSIKIRPTFIGRFRTKIDYKIVKEKKFGNKFIYIFISKNIAKNIKKLEVVAIHQIQRNEFRKNLVSIPINFVHNIDKGKYRKYLASERLIPINDYYRTLALKVLDGDKNDYQKLYSLYNYVANHGKYYKLDIIKLKPSGIGYSNYCDRYGTGNCTDYHAYFMSLARPSGFPVRHIMGTYLNPKNNGYDVDNSYHCWVETYIPSAGWIPLDPSWGNYYSAKKEYYFLNLEEERIVFSIGRNFFLPKSNYIEPLFIFATILQKEDNGKYKKIKNFTRKLRFWKE